MIVNGRVTPDAEADDAVPEASTAYLVRRTLVEAGKALSALGLALFSLAALFVALVVSVVFGMRTGSVSGQECEVAARGSAIDPCSGWGAWLRLVLVFVPIAVTSAAVVWAGLRRKSLVRQWSWVVGGCLVGLVAPFGLVVVLHW